MGSWWGHSGTGWIYSGVWIYSTGWMNSTGWIYSSGVGITEMWRSQGDIEKRAGVVFVSPSFRGWMISLP